MRVWSIAFTLRGGLTTFGGSDSGVDVRPLGALDWARCAVVGPRGMTDLAVTLTGLCRPRSFRMSLVGLRARNAWALVEHGRVRGLASIRQRSGPRSWELSHLYVGSEPGQAVVRLLERAAAGAGAYGGERVFLRVEADSPIVPTARLAGYFPSHLETVYRGTAGRRDSIHSLFDADSHLWKRLPEHDHALFRLYNAATPVKVRQLVGMTFDQWASSHERGPGKPRESALRVEGDVQGWLRTSARFGTGNLSVRLHPDYDALTPEVVEAGLRRLKETRTVFAVVEEYAPRFATALEGLGFEAQGECVVLVKSVAQRVLEQVPGKVVTGGFPRARE